ncbi:zinc finger MYM-type protein 3 isoform X3 [Thamnophis elegans]|uniref:zinc finger MYM-type protein 3 isoform X3 n=1 Tax=Thamnophis elegans TaxID=35005 RepID=UPI001378F72E|nr:zinc finger MYM-type protein 3 isoform X3 [Thamnophis elegans]
MDSSEFPASLGPLPLHNKPLIGDLPAGLEFGEDLLASQTASIPQAATAQPQEMEWEASKQAASDGSSQFGVGKAADLSTVSKSNSLALSKASTLDHLEKPGLLGSLSKGGGQEGLEKSGDPDGFFKARGSLDPENGTEAPPVPGTEQRLSPEALQEEEEGGSQGGTGQESHTKQPSCAPNRSAEEDPEVVEVSSVPPSQEAAPSSGSPTTSPRLAKKPRLKPPKKSALDASANAKEEEGAPPNSLPEPVPPLPPVPEVAEGSLSAATKESGPSEATKGREAGAPPSLAGEGAGAKGAEAPVEREQKRSERARRAEVSRPETVNSSESIPVSDEDSDAMVDDPNDEDFVPFRTRRPTRLSLRNQMAQRAARSTVTKMNCANCRTPLQKGQTAYQRKGLPQLFCSSSCLTTFSKRPLSRKSCTFCKKDIWNTKESVVAQIDNSFHEFCTSVCLSLYEAQQQQRPAPQAAETSDTIRCSVCYKTGEIQHEVSNGSVVHRICSDACFTKFRATKGLKTNCCDSCGLYLYNKGAPLEFLFHEGQQKRFCNPTCLNSYKKKHTRVYPCMWCKTLCKNFDMLSHKDRNGKLGLFCSVCCTTSYKVKQAGLTGPVRPCSFCRKSLSEPCYYNKNKQVVYQFCSPSCWTKFQRSSPEGEIHLTCHSCHNLFTGKPEILDWQDNVYQFCCRDCCEDFKRLQGVVSQCEHCKQEKLLHEKIRFSGVEKNFCSEGQAPEPKQPSAAAQKAEPSAEPAKTAPTSPTSAAPQPPQPVTPRKNKSAMCKPLMQNRGISCKTEMKSKGCQTDDWKPQVIVLPIPVPVFVPVPMNMYCQKVPVPFSMPVPVPVPMFLPTTLESTEKIVETIEELKVKIPSNPLEADILAMAEMIAEAEELDKASSDLCDLVSNQSAEGLLEDCDLFGPARDDVLAMAVKMANVLDEPGQDLEADFPKSEGSARDPLDINPSVDFLFDCSLVAPEDVAADPDLPRAIRKGQKRLVLSESCSRDSVSSQPSGSVLNSSYGVNAWKSWVQAKYVGAETSKGDELRFGPKPMRIKEDILACTAAELNYGLAQFVKEITRPNGERYEPDSIYYLCLGIQQYLLENNRMVNIFTDLYYLTFVQELNKLLSGWQPSVLPNSTVFSRVEEEHLWDCKQLGVYSPFVLLNTLMFFNTKYFGLQTAEEHMQLSFTNVVRQSRKCTMPRGSAKVVSIRYYAPVRHRKGRESGLGKRKREEEAPVLEQRENRLNPLRCPVKFYEFYLSKCPESLRSRNDVFYLQPERSCIAESPLWYSVIPMDKSMLESMLNRILAVREIYEEHSRGVGGLDDDMD